ncbi:hypothetical protein BJ165DRAFT_1502817 [Panaeolus papilionaceus]|nr:hypothetical protein BJ165DRAFT_1502817 [Panaeolus papilionaceus]
MGANHLISGREDDYNYRPINIKEALVYKAAGGIENLALSTKVELGGHLVPQSNPKKNSGTNLRHSAISFDPRTSRLDNASAAKL